MARSSGATRWLNLGNRSPRSTKPRSRGTWSADNSKAGMVRLGMALPGSRTLHGSGELAFAGAVLIGG